MTRAIQPADLSSADFNNNGSLAAGGVTIDKAALSTLAAGVPVAAPGPDGPVDYYNTSTSPWNHYHWDGTVWKLVGDGSGAGADGVVTAASLSGANILSLTRSIGAPVVVDLSALAGGASPTNLTYTASPTNGIVVSSTGLDATIPLVTTVNAGLVPPRDGNAASVLRGDGTWGASPTNLTYTAAPTQGTVVSDTGTDAVIPVASTVNAGLGPARSGIGTDYLAGDGTYKALLSAGTPVLTQKGTKIVVTASGTYTRTGTDVVYATFEVQGGGAGGGGVGSTAGLQPKARAAAGGGAGGYAQLGIWGVPATAAVVVGAGGAGGVGDVDGASGGTTTLTVGTRVVTASGGIGGSRNRVVGFGGVAERLLLGHRGEGGSATGGDVNIQGRDAQIAISVGGTMNGGNTVVHSSAGGRSSFGGPIDADQRWYSDGTAQNGNGIGPIATQYGTGGGGAYSYYGAAAADGANGANGVVVITEYTA